MRASSRRLAVAVLSAFVIAAGVFAQQPAQVPGAIRSKIVLVPVDVRVIDRNGNPVTDLTEKDFTVLEDGVPQQVGHFSTQAFEAAAAGPLPSAPALRQQAGLEATPVSHRTFLILLGRGRLQYPSRGLDAVREFVRDRALPTDLIAMQAYGRMTDFTTDRVSLLAMLDLYEKRHERLEALLDHWFRDQWMHDLEASPGIERKIAAFFEEPGMPPVRRVPVFDVDGETPFERRRHAARLAERWLHNDVIPDPGERDFVYEPGGRDDITKLVGAIEFLKYFAGEKHILYLSERGLVGTRSSLDGDLIAARAADARVSVSTIRTGGLDASWGSAPRGNGRRSDVIFMGPPAATWWANADAREIAKRTGGVASAYKYAAETIGAMDRATRFQYLLGYYPANIDWNGEPRRIEVRVNRSGVTVLHRQSYFAREDLVPFDRRAFLTHSRITGAGAYRVPMRDVGITVTGAVYRDADRQWHAKADVTIDGSTVAFELIDGRHVAELDVAVFVGARNQRQVGEVSRRIELKLEPASYARAIVEGVKFETTIAVTGQPRYLKAVVYDYAADRLGSAAVEIR